MITEMAQDDPARDPRQQPAELLKRVGDPVAVDWLVKYNAYCHIVDDLVDGDVDPKTGALEAALQAMTLYSHPFWIQNHVRLLAVARLCHLNYADSVDWEDSPHKWQRAEADTIRHCGSDMVRAVVDLIGGMDEARRISPILRIIGYEDHHDAQGNPH